MGVYEASIKEQPGRLRGGEPVWCVACVTRVGPLHHRSRLASGCHHLATMPPLDLLLRHRTNAFFRSLVSHRIQLYSVASVLAISAVILNALRNYSNFYSVAIYLSKSGRSVLVRVYYRAHFETQLDSCPGSCEFCNPLGLILWTHRSAYLLWFTACQ